MNPKDPREAYLRIIESQARLANRFSGVKRLGTGTFSLLFKAYDDVTGKDVALKVFNPSHYHDTYRWECFKREPTVLKQFAGTPDILQWVSPLESFSVGVKDWPDQQFFFYSTELALGDIQQYLITLPSSWLDRLDRFRAMCRSVQRIHAAGVVHRDIKPANFLTHGARTMLSDFGTARSLIGDDPILSGYGVPVGEMTYSAPELFAGLQDIEPEVYFKSDLYALGATFFELFTRTPLNPQLFDSTVLGDLVRVMNLVPRASRTHIYHELLLDMRTRRPLPKLQDFAGDIPVSIQGLFDRLYCGLCAIDYRIRLSDFNRIFSYVNQATIILRREAEYEHMREKRELYAMNAEQKRARRIIKIGAGK